MQIKAKVALGVAVRLQFWMTVLHMSNCNIPLKNVQKFD